MSFLKTFSDFGSSINENIDASNIKTVNTDDYHRLSTDLNFKYSKGGTTKIANQIVNICSLLDRIDGNNIQSVYYKILSVDANSAFIAIESSVKFIDKVLTLLKTQKN
jgi:hypothetical protein